jgi:hypothetical protein
MELFLNLCWLSLLLPAWLLWRQRTSSTGSVNPGQSSGAHPLVFICALGCALILLFPVISASDDLHAMRPEMEESKRASRHASHCGCTSHTPAHASQPSLLTAALPTPQFAQAGTVLPFESRVLGIFSPPAPVGRAPPFDRLVSL